MIANAIVLLCVRNYFKCYILTHLFSNNLTITIHILQMRKLGHRLVHPVVITLPVSLEL